MAAAAGVSVSTASRVLGGSSRTTLTSSRLGSNALGGRLLDELLGYEREGVADPLTQRSGIMIL
ncbi:hypothetical protein [Streptomyces chartreusis]|uniref:hypothetical protein n=1 Tax=Streptomyces chartreusis TaxID=1969 RepID=UPI003F53F639